MRFTARLRALGRRRAQAVPPRRAQPASVDKQSASRGDDGSYVILSPAMTNIHLVGSDANRRAHARVAAVCDEIMHVLDHPYAPVARIRMNDWVRTLEQLKGRRAVPHSDLHRVEAHL